MRFQVSYFISHKRVTNPQRIKEAVEGQVRKYSLQIPKLGISAAESRGRRGEQEDRIDFSEINGFELLSEAQQDTVIRETVAQAQMANAKEYAGSCLLTCIVTPIFNGKNLINYRITTINLGDSEAMVLEKNDDAQSVIKLLNSSHHLTEEHRINNSVTSFSLNVKRSIGDYCYHASVHLPEIKRTTITANKNHHLFLFCDGIRETSKLHTELESESCAIHPEAYPLAENIVDLAYNSLSGDNLSVITMALNGNTALLKPYALSIYDGHGGDEVAEYLRINFLKLLANNVQLKLKKMNRPKHEFCEFFHSKLIASKNPEFANEKCKKRQNR